MAAELLDRELIAGIRLVEQASGRNDMLLSFVAKLEENLAAFPGAFSACVARGDAAGAARAAHTLKGSCHQLGAPVLGELFGDIERSAKDGDYVAAMRQFEDAATLISQSLDALKRA
jgi:HPt (histidine-containing phosphotransfer) domain-containing protein